MFTLNMLEYINLIKNVESTEFFTKIKLTLKNRLS